MSKRPTSSNSVSAASQEHHIHLLLPLHVSMGQTLFNGIVAYAGERIDWRCGVIRNVRSADIAKIAPQNAHALLGVLRRKLSEHLDKDQRRRVVNTSRGYNDGEIANVTCDDWKIGCMAANHLLGKKLQSFAYCGGLSGREAGFAQRIREANQPYECLPTHDTSEKDIECWLSSLPRRTGVMCFNDEMAAIVLWAAQRIGRAVPEDLAIVGVDADPVQSFLAPVSISSIDPNFHMVGYQAAELLDQILEDGYNARGKTIRIPPAGVIEQGSSDFPGIDDPQVIAAARFIRRHACDGIQVGDVVAEIPLSRRPLERRFRTVFGRTLLAEIHRVRVSEATRLLQQTELPIASVAKQVGFNGNDRLTEAFRTLLGTTPAAYRQSKHKNKS